ncbi:MAG: hypothetical protein COV07_03435 [Candidatus Vogelbacteria bacterium CG10_big_fil_rev_8_21_14_0_10_45_14]|uniref:Uncharacterized protein n=1 Tax=Candidatus Vogelbacteria bacterium CG10_big_fil_rev_8_21_14_0_10_45_14 TaxID=1975042 RepID=A0A2H0RJ75_9BACT|nr:MAG: hypothetical protein COV07_03435 [Candidatus Vogelbacteria bacterium CG10_big_fil_rev_8_21_14_0_10_45_14]
MSAKNKEFVPIQATHGAGLERARLEREIQDEELVVAMLEIAATLAHGDKSTDESIRKDNNNRVERSLACIAKLKTLLKDRDEQFRVKVVHELVVMLGGESIHEDRDRATQYVETFIRLLLTQSK